MHLPCPPFAQSPVASLTLSQLSKTYPNGHQAVVDVDLDVADGELVVLVGPSGCGKSTTLRMIAGLEQPTSGDIAIAGKSVVATAPGKRDIAMVFQNYALYPHMNVEKNMAFGLKMRRTPKAEIAQRVRATAAMLGIEDLLARKPAQLSGGQRQRVALGRAIVRDPQVFLFDEPLSNLDAQLRVQTRTEIAALHQRLSATMIYVTHDQVEAMTLGDRLVLMNQGRVQQVDTPMQVYRRPANQFVATFIGSPAMNLLDAVVESGKIKLSPRGPALEVDASVEDGSVKIGVRPEDISTTSEGRYPLGEGIIEAVEHLGHSVLVHVSLAGCRCIARAPATAQFTVGDQLSLATNDDCLHVFEATDAGRRLGTY